MAINRGPGGSGDASNAASNASAIATVKAQEAAESAASALSSANNAAISASSASASASSATASASAASGSATTASSASSTATTQAGIATTKASEASTSAANALTSETNAATSADLAEDWAIKTSGPVSGSEYSSKYHAGLASTSATSANNAKTSAEAARDATLAAYDQFDDRYLGTKTTDPTVDNDGNALVAGSLYFNSVSGVMRLYTGSAWVAAYVSGTASSIAVTPAGNIASTNVQTALQELDGEKQATLTAGSITTSLIANNAITSAKMANGGAELGMRNRIINGAMQIDQRNAGASVTASASGSYYAVDRTLFFKDSAAAFTLQQSSVAPSGFNKSLLVTVTTASSSGSGNGVLIQQNIEGLNTGDLSFGTATPSTITVSFWVRSSLTGTYCVALRNSAFNRSYVAEYSISSANTWEYKTVTIVGDTTGTWLTDNGAGIRVGFDLGSGSNANATVNTWTASAATRTTSQANFANTSGATFYITGVQLEKGSQATAFEWRPYGTELALCQRYYQSYYLRSLYINGTGYIGGAYPTQQPMRVSPSITFTDLGGTGNRITVGGINGIVIAAGGINGTFSSSQTTALVDIILSSPPALNTWWAAVSYLNAEL
jgi:hypothetical protein